MEQKGLASLPINSNLCFDPNDDFLIGKSIWVAELSNKSRVYCDDDRPNILPSSAWLRLKNYLNQTGLTISGVYLSRKCRTCFVQVPESNLAYSVVRGQTLILTGGQRIDTIVVCSLQEQGKRRYWLRQAYEVNSLQLVEQSEQPEERYQNSAIYHHL